MDVDLLDRRDFSPVRYRRVSEKTGREVPWEEIVKKNGRRAYALLREVMSRTGKMGIAKVVIRTREHLAAVFAEGPVLICNVLRFAHELRDPKQLDIPELDSKRLGISEREVKMAQQLVEAMTGEWNPQKYRDEYREDLLALIDKKVKTGRTKAVRPAEKRPARAEGKKEEPARRRKAG
jgi:DNA end-binding protein Ku